MSTSSSADGSRPALDFLLKWLPGAALTGALVAHAWGVVTWAPVRQLDAWLHDMRLLAAASTVPPSAVAVIDIDERSLAAVGRWPWSRDRLAALVRRLFEHEGAAVVGLDLILAEPDTSSGLPVLEAWAAGPLADDREFLAALASRRAELDRDGQLAAVMARHPVVLGFHVSRGPGATRSGTLPAPWMPDEALAGLPRFEGYGGNLERFAAAAAGAGFLDAWVDPDGVRRRAPLLAQIDGQVQGAWTLALAQALHGGRWRSENAAGVLQTLVLDGRGGRLPVPVGADGAIVLPYARPQGWAPVYAAVDVLQGRVAPRSLQGRGC